MLFSFTPQTCVSQTETFASSPGTSSQLEPTGLAWVTPSLFRILPSLFVPQILPEDPDEIHTSLPSTFFHADPALKWVTLVRALKQDVYRVTDIKIDFPDICSVYTFGLWEVVLREHNIVSPEIKSWGRQNLTLDNLECAHKDQALCPRDPTKESIFQCTWRADGLVYAHVRKINDRSNADALDSLFKNKCLLTYLFSFP